MAHLIISDLAATETLDRKAVTSVKGGKLSRTGGFLLPYPFFPGPQYQTQNIAVNAAQLAHNFGYGTINQSMGISVNATQS